MAVKLKRPINIELDMPPVAVVRPQRQPAVDGDVVFGMHKEIEGFELILNPFRAIDLG